MCAAASSMKLVNGVINTSTKVTFPLGSLADVSRVVGAITMVDQRVALVLAETPFHPVNQAWPDQPADRGTLNFFKMEKPLVVEACETLAVHKESGDIVSEKGVSRKESEKYHFVVAHVVTLAPERIEALVNLDVQAVIDSEYRKMLSLHHSACHLAALALNEACTPYWTKEVQMDSLGHPDFDKLTMDTSFIFEDRSEDVYRFGKSIKKKGLNSEPLLAHVKMVEAVVNKRLAEWVSTAAPVTITRDGPCVNDRRTWRCTLPQGVGEMPCGGTHVATLEAFKGIRYSLEVVGEQEEKRLRAVTRAIPA